MNLKCEQSRPRPVHLAIAVLAALTVAGSHAGASERRGERAVETIESRPAGEPVLAIVSLQNQRMRLRNAAIAARQGVKGGRDSDSVKPARLTRKTHQSCSDFCRAGPFLSEFLTG